MREFFKLNITSWSLIIITVFAIITLHIPVYQVDELNGEFFMITLTPTILLVIGVISSEKAGKILKISAQSLTRMENFRFDFFVMVFSVVTIIFITVILNRHNGDFWMWWPFILVIMGIEGMLFSLFFSTIGILLRSHRNYTIGFSFIFLLYAIFASNAIKFEIMDSKILGFISLRWSVFLLLFLSHLCIGVVSKIMTLKNLPSRE